MRPWKWTTRSPHDPSFSPDRAQRELRALTRYRKSLVDERRAEVNRLQKTLEGASSPPGRSAFLLTWRRASKAAATGNNVPSVFLVGG
jgi:transposase